MNATIKEPLSQWREEGCQLIQDNFEIVSKLISKARYYAQCGNYDVAAMYAENAALYGFLRHSGLFVSFELEQILLTIGKKTIKNDLYRDDSSSLPKPVKNVLHIASYVKSIGGHSRMIWRWIDQDKERIHSLVLTRTTADEVPQILRNAVLKSQGKIYGLSRGINSYISRAKRLQEISASADVVVLHISPNDVIPILAFADKKQSPPIIFIDHADHGFWLGAMISDVVANLRKSGMYISQKRRGIEPERNVLLPIILPSIHRTLSRKEAKRKLGFNENTVLLLSIARSPKYRTIDAINFADVHIPLLKRYEEAVLVIIGPGNSEDWSMAIEQTQGRIKIFGEREDTDIFYQAADIYVDSFPIVSTTSLLEAGSYATPLVSRYPYSDLSSIIGADTPGLDNNLLRAKDINEYTAILSRLIEEKEFRQVLGQATQQQIVQTHTGNNWQQSLEALYLRVVTMPKRFVPSTLVLTDQIFIGEPDVFLPIVFRYASSQEKTDPDDLVINGSDFLPFEERLHLWIRLIKKGNFGRRGRLSLLLPTKLSNLSKN